MTIENQSKTVFISDLHLSENNPELTNIFINNLICIQVKDKLII